LAGQAATKRVLQEQGQIQGDSISSWRLRSLSPSVLLTIVCFEFGHLKAGESVLVQAGASGVGVAAIQLAKRAGATVIATASSDQRLERLRPLGMDHGIN
jgi:NADPH:quinone reductase-like Zn-dependent oxidoreductase